MRAQKARVGAILGPLDTIIIPANPPAGFAVWQGFGPQAEWDTFMHSEPLMEHWANEPVKQANQDKQGGSAAVLARRQGVRNLIDDIEGMNDYLRTMPARQWPF
ncbi:hypothetical protein MFIFM68171_11325 [Madurella fahalii]|uniref:Uncharacterized protein n=1 Tax=Madurella fahalii TaxID=1157608 RepID=A0ABQ0GTP7_9PEZI